jgi:hypothetical protein
VVLTRAKGVSSHMCAAVRDASQRNDFPRCSVSELVVHNATATWCSVLERILFVISRSGIRVQKSMAWVNYKISLSVMKISEYEAGISFQIR